MPGRSRHLLLALGGLLVAQPAFALSIPENIARQLLEQGFAGIQVEDTWLGRTRIIGSRLGETREIIVNPTTGEVLRDLWLDEKGQVKAADIEIDDDDDDDVDKDDKDDKDEGAENDDKDANNSGSGSDDGDDD